MAIVKIYEQQKEWAIKIAAGVATGIFFYVVMVQPFFQDIMISRQGIMDAKKRVELYKEIQGLKERLENGENSLATLSERSQFLGKISDIAGRAKFHIGTLTPRTEPDGGFIKLKMEMEGQGSFFSLLRFLRGVEKAGAAVKVKDVSALWSPSQKNQQSKDSLQIQLVFETLLKKRSKKIDG
jgi:hypothetical protein